MIGVRYHQSCSKYEIKTVQSIPLCVVSFSIVIFKDHIQTIGDQHWLWSIRALSHRALSVCFEMKPRGKKITNNIFEPYTPAYFYKSRWLQSDRRTLIGCWQVTAVRLSVDRVMVQNWLYSSCYYHFWMICNCVYVASYIVLLFMTPFWCGVVPKN